MEDNVIGSLVKARHLAASGTGRYIRVSSGLSLRELARAVAERAQCTVSPTTVLRWERGEKRPSGDRAIAYLVVLERVAAAASGQRQAVA